MVQLLVFLVCTESEVMLLTRNIYWNDTGWNHLRVILYSLFWCGKRQGFGPVVLFVQGGRYIGNRTFRSVAHHWQFTICFCIGSSLMWDDFRTVKLYSEQEWQCMIKFTYSKHTAKCKDKIVSQDHLFYTVAPKTFRHLCSHT